MLALRAIEIGPEDSVVVPAFTCAATALPVIETGAQLVFADIHPATYNLTWETVARVLKRNTRAVIAAHMFGRVCDAEQLAIECRRRRIALIEDAALALGAKSGGRCAGTHGVAGCFSFHPRKILTTGEGGAVCTDDVRLAERVRASRNYGAARTAWARFKSRDGSPRGFSRMAFNCKLTDLQAAVGLMQLQRLPDFLARRREIARQYATLLANCPPISLPKIPANEVEHVFQAYVCAWLPAPFDEFCRRPGKLRAACGELAAFKARLTQAGVAVSDAAQFLPDLPVFGGKTAHLPYMRAYVAARLAFALPIYPGMTDAEVKTVARSVRKGVAVRPRK
jgi:dTDP-4-amino-4,6-dideoxygalactose transaminase